MNTHVDTEQLSAYLDGQVAGSSRAQLEAHLSSCRECTARKSRLEGAIRAVAALPQVSPTADEVRAIRQSVIERAGSRGRVPGRRPAWNFGARTLGWRLYAAAGAVAVLLAGVVGYAAIVPSGEQSTASRPAPGEGTSKAFSSDASSSADGPVFSSLSQVRAYAASQAAVAQGAGGYRAQDAPAATSDFLSRLQGGAAPGSATGGPNATAPRAAAPLPQAVTAASPAPASASSLDTGTLTGCVQSVLRDQPPTMVPLKAVPATYQGKPAWLLIYASTPAGSPNGALSQVRVFVQSQTTCQTLDQSSFMP